MRKAADVAEDLHLRLRDLERELASLSGELEVRLSLLSSIPLSPSFGY
jgi:hypothetical protein